MTDVTNIKTTGITSINGERERVSKSDARVCLLGDIDELNAHLGMIKAIHNNEDVRRFIEMIQNKVSIVMAHVSDPSNVNYVLCDGDVNTLKEEADKLSQNIPPRFVLPGRNILDAHIHIARTIARRAERSAVAVNEDYPISPNALSYLNYLSGYLFALARNV